MTYRLILLVAIALASAPSQAGEKPSPWTDNYGEVRSPTIPKKVRKFVIDAQACAHFSGEASGEDNDRERYVQKVIRQTCTNIEKRREKLLVKYRGNGEVEAIIAEVWEPFT